MEKKKIAAAAIVLVLVGAGIFYTQIQNSGGYKGQVEGVMVSHATEVSGKIRESSIQLGGTIKKGDILAVIDDTNQQYVVEQLRLNLQKAKLAVSNSKVGAGGVADNNYTAAQASYDSAQALAQKAKTDYQRAKSLYETDAISQEALDSAKVADDTAAAAEAAAAAKLKNAGDKSATSSAQLDVAILESQLHQQEDLLKKYTITAQCDGILMSQNYREGDVVAVGYDIADISSQAERYVVIYYPKEKLAQIQLGQKAQVGWTGHTLTGTVQYLDVKAQYTPKDMQTAANRNQKTLRVKILLPADSDLQVGQRVNVKV
ncbi:HlyD family efflux transporter periplasmic adaptor subunit [Aminipila butyrica]|uniref:HlyD family efflux transporter periplasmic adaptor subunit n=1 Tax=Aminipila butyrica TaxID=433296 RepID=A0A858BYB1_9FIRM|nr:HlyD family efflux transporter periplasmic adaptor subunit [Aminipila butyrica]QIB70199.1 HlyD family efflux transporter periplasmic adaptor subunit [Aminipila butyrica]